MTEDRLETLLTKVLALAADTRALTNERDAALAAFVRLAERYGRTFPNCFRPT